MVVEGGPPASAKSFAEVLQASLAFQKVVIPVHDPAFTDKGESACFFSKDEIGASLSPVRFAVIAKTPYGRPPFQEIRNHIQQRCSLTGYFVISSIDSLHLLIRFALEDDFLKVLLRESLLVRGKVFKFFKWSPLLRPNEDPHIIPIWIDLPGLPINLYQECFVRSIACNVGKVLQVAHDTVNLINTQAARVCVEVDLLLPRKERIWIGMGDYGYWQVILYPSLPAYCTSCKRIGHGADSCGASVSKVNKDSSVLLKKNQAPLPNPATKTVEPAPKQNTTANWRQVPKGKRKIDIHLPSDVPSTSTSNMFNLLDSSGAGGVEEAADGVKEGGSCPAPVFCPAPSIPALPAAPAASPTSQEAVVHDLHGAGKAHASTGVDVHGEAALPCGGGSSGVRVSPETRPVLEEGETPLNLQSRVSVADVALEGFLQVSSQAAVESSVALAKQAEPVAEITQEKESSLSPSPVDSASRFHTAAEITALNSATRDPGAHGETLQRNTLTRESKSTAVASSNPVRDPSAAPSNALMETTNSASWGPALAPPSAAALAIPAPINALSADCFNAAPKILVDPGEPCATLPPPSGSPVFLACSNRDLDLRGIPAVNNTSEASNITAGTTVTSASRAAFNSCPTTSRDPAQIKFFGASQRNIDYSDPIKEGSNNSDLQGLRAEDVEDVPMQSSPRWHTDLSGSVDPKNKATKHLGDVSLFHLVKNMQKRLISNTSLPTATNESQLQGNTTPSSNKSDIMVDIDNIIQRTVEADLAFNGPPAQKEDRVRQMNFSKISRSGKDPLQIPQSPAGGVGNDVSNSSGTRKMISRPRHKGGVRICLPYPRARSPSPPPPTIPYPTSLNMEVGRSVTEQARADNILMPCSTFPDEESDDHDEEDDADDYVDERCRRRPGLRPRGALRHSHSWDDFSLEF